jgi:FkbM family methyltransferase
MKKKLIIYGFGSFSKCLINDLKKKIKIDLIIDKASNAKSYKGIKIKKISELNNLNCNEYNCLIALNNHYLNIKIIYKNLLKKGFNKIYTPINFPNIKNIFSYKDSYFLSNKKKYNSKQINIVGRILKDKKSLSLLKKVVKYRNKGSISDYPEPSIMDEYMPKNIINYSREINLIDCGAHTGQVIKKFIKNNYKIKNLIAFEPDRYNFKKLLEIKKKITNSKIFPYGVWDKNVKLPFNSLRGLNSRIGSGKIKKNKYVEFVKLDDYAKNFHPDIIKYDVEGSEIEALKGSKKTIFRYLPSLCISIYHKHDHLYKIPLLINSWKLNYNLYLRLHEYNTFGLVLYCFKNKRL